MPLYAYQNKKTGDVVEELYASGERPEQVTRNGEVYHYVIAPSSFVLRGKTAGSKPRSG